MLDNGIVKAQTAWSTLLNASAYSFVVNLVRLVFLHSKWMQCYLHIILSFMLKLVTQLTVFYITEWFLFLRVHGMHICVNYRVQCWELVEFTHRLTTSQEIIISHVNVMTLKVPLSCFLFLIKFCKFSHNIVRCSMNLSVLLYFFSHSSQYYSIQPKD